MKVILYQKEPGSDEAIVVTPNVQNGLTVEETAERDVPYRVPYVIEDQSVLPADIEYYSAVRVDFSEPDGLGLGLSYWREKKRAEFLGLEFADPLEVPPDEAPPDPNEVSDE